jgi:tetratricopeptide (TPR) repeat protein
MRATWRGICLAKKFLAVSILTLSVAWDSEGFSQTLPPASDVSQPTAAVSAKPRIYLALETPNAWRLAQLATLHKIDEKDYPGEPVPKHPATFAMVFGSPLAWQVARQAVLLSAREELGLLTGDYFLDDVPPTDAKSMTLEVTGSFNEIEEDKVIDNEIRLWNRRSSPHEELWKSVFSPVAEPFDYAAFAAQYETLSRTEIADALRKVVGPMEELGEQAVVDVEGGNFTQELEQLDFVSQYALLRKLHGMRAGSGKSPSMLCNLVQNYAQLGMLTRHYQHPMHTVFDARALLYSQRLVQKFPDSQQARYYRGFAIAMTGMSKLALAEFEAAKSMKPESLEDSPEWLPWLEALCRLQRVELEQFAKSSAQKPLPYLLWFVAAEQAVRNDVTTAVGIEVAQVLPECYRIYDGISESGGIGALHRSTQIPHAVLATTLYKRIEKLPDLPPPVKVSLNASNGILQNLFGRQQGNSTLDELRKRVAVIKSLRDADKRPAVSGEENVTTPPYSVDGPGWTLLASMVCEESFKQIAQRTRFLSKSLGVEPDSYLEAMEPLISDHPFKAFVETYSWKSERVDSARKHIISNRMDLPLQMIGSGFRPKFRKPRDSELSYRVGGYSDDTSYGLTNRLMGKNLPARTLIEACPDSPFAKAILLREEFPYALHRLPEWDASADQHPRLLHELAVYYERHRKLDDAEKCLKRAIDAFPCLSAHRSLADFYLRCGDEKQWLVAVEEALASTDDGLGHASLRVEVSKHYRSKRNWNQAEVYAAAAAESYAGWAMDELTLVYEGQQDFVAAEEWYRTRFNRYGGQPWKWYYFCKRNALQVPGEVTQALGPMVAQYQTNLRPESAGNAGWYFMMEGEVQKAAASFEIDFKLSPTAAAGLLAALAYEASGNLEKRDELLAAIKPVWKRVNPLNPKGTRILALADAIGDDLASTKEKERKAGFAHAPPGRIDKLRSQGTESEWPWIDYFSGLYCANNDNESQAISYWKRAMSSTLLDHQARTMSGYELAKRGVDPREYKAALDGELIEGFQQ